MLKRITISIIDFLAILFYPFGVTILLLFFLTKRIFRSKQSFTKTLNKIAIITPSVPPDVDGGIASAHYNLYLTLKKKGFEVKLFSFQYLQNKPENDDIICVPAYSNRLKFLLHKFWYWNYRFFEFWGNTPAHQLLDIVSTAPCIFNLNKYVLEYNPSLIVISDQGMPGLFLSCKLQSKIVVITHHNPARFYKVGTEKYNNTFDILLAKWFETQFYKTVTGILSPSQYMVNFTKNCHHYSGPIQCMYNIVNYAYIDGIVKQDIPGTFDHLVYIPSAGSKVKGSHYVKKILDGLGEVLPHKKIGFYLSGELGENFQITLQKDLPENCTLYIPGRTDYAQNIGFIKACDLCISPTLIENFSMALLEANYLGLPVITFNIGGNKELVKNGISGYIVEELNTSEIVSKAILILSNNSAIKMDCKSHVLQHFNETSCIETFQQFLIQL